ncbi:MAG: DJ-1/PfpI family protein [Chitinophaga sp.]|uniref:DJ-1/PfpI family protein n=1 Tax=Chitinophaga sp. TaxID=1869181 RepID=UPI0025C46688|nr:DJ-1/PfpI family protein [Chitinophaga sp.]MBV8252087.1 DJ-1/PfpI family protein [Chitinophaga sp.]
MTINLKMTISLLLVAGTLVSILLHGCKPLKEFYHFPGYKGVTILPMKPPAYDPAKKTVFIIADNAGTELFDMMAPFYLFNLTGKANVYLLAKDSSPIIMRKGVFVLPQLTFAQASQMQLQPAVVIVPALSPMDIRKQDPQLLRYISHLHTDSTLFLAVCQGALTLAATGLYDGKPMTTHASELSSIRKQYPKTNWVKNVTYTTAGNLYSTSGVSNAVDGSLMVINKLFGEGTMQQVMSAIHYPHTTVPQHHDSRVIGSAAKWRIARKIFFESNKKIGLLLENNLDELTIAGILDTYYRTFPAAVNSYTMDNLPICSKFGLTIIPTGNIVKDKPDELHMPGNMPDSVLAQIRSKKITVVSYNNGNDYIINTCLRRIRSQYGTRFQGVVEEMLDYNK